KLQIESILRTFEFANPTFQRNKKEGLNTSRSLGIGSSGNSTRCLSCHASGDDLDTGVSPGEDSPASMSRNIVHNRIAMFPPVIHPPFIPTSHHGRQF
ncbi:hypothetical protein ACHAXS_011050, partial [Conticribra weissflogii]